MKIKTITVNNYVFGFLLMGCIIATPAGAYEVIQGSQYPVCKAVSESMPEPDEISSTSSLAYNKHSGLKEPSWEPAYDLIGLKLHIQSESYSYSPGKTLMKWEKLLSYTKKIMKRDFTVSKAKIDINNDGYLDQIIQTSWKSDDNLQTIFRLSYIVDDYNNLNFSFYKKGKFPYIPGEIFIFNNRVFSIVKTYTYDVNEHFPGHEKKIGGLFIRHAICKIK